MIEHHERQRSATQVLPCSCGWRGGGEPVDWEPGTLLTSMEFQNHLVNRLTIVALDVLDEARPLLAELDEILRLIDAELKR